VDFTELFLSASRYIVSGLRPAYFEPVQNLEIDSPADWRRQLGRPRITWLSTIQQDLKQHHLTLPQGSRFGSEQPSVEDDVDTWRYAVLELHAKNDDDASRYVITDLFPSASRYFISFAPFSQMLLK